MGDFSMLKHSIALLICLIPSCLSQELVGLGLRRADLVWNDRGSGGDRDLSLWSPQLPTGENWKTVGHYAQGNYADVSEAIYAFRDISEDGSALATPLAFTQMWDDQDSGADRDVSVWRATCPEGYVSLGDFAYGGNRISDPINLYNVATCVRRNLVHPCYFGNKIYDDRGTGSRNDVSLWSLTDETVPETVNQFFLSSPFHDV